MSDIQRFAERAGAVLEPADDGEWVAYGHHVAAIVAAADQARTYYEQRLKEETCARARQERMQGMWVQGREAGIKEARDAVAALAPYDRYRRPATFFSSGLVREEPRRNRFVAITLDVDAPDP